MDGLQRLIDFLGKLEQCKIAYKLEKVRDAIMVEIAVPGQRWEVEYMYDGTIEVEKFLTDNKIANETELEIIFRDFSE